MRVQAKEDIVRHTGLDAGFIFRTNNKFFRSYRDQNILFMLELFLYVFQRYAIAARKTERALPVLHQQMPLQHIGSANKCCDKCVCRTLINILRCTDMLNYALIHNCDPIRDGHCLFLVVRYIHRSNANIILNLLNDASHFHAQFCVEV